MLADNLSLTSSKLKSLDDDLLRYAKSLGYGELHIKFDQAQNLEAIIAIHSTKLGPALGGCRLREYPSYEEAIKDAIRLAQGMSYKAAMVGLPLGGGKSVLLKPPHITDRHTYFKTFGRFIDDLGGRYITAMDSGTNIEDMDAIAESTRYVTSTSKGNGDPSPYTATGVRESIEAAVLFKYGKKDLGGIRIAVQGVGHVGHYLIQELHERDAILTIADTSKEAIATILNQFPSIKVVDPTEIHRMDCDIFAPCAMGAILNEKTIPEIKASMIIGAANNQLATPQDGEALLKRGILYGPDFIVNSGGLICACGQFYNTPHEKMMKQVTHISDTILLVLERAATENKATNFVADMMAEEKLQSTI